MSVRFGTVEGRKSYNVKLYDINPEHVSCVDPVNPDLHEGAQSRLVLLNGDRIYTKMTREELVQWLKSI